MSAKTVDSKNVKKREIRETDVKYIAKNYDHMTAVEIGAKKGLAYFQVSGIIVGLRKAKVIGLKRGKGGMAETAPKGKRSAKQVIAAAISKLSL